MTIHPANLPPPKLFECHDCCAIVREDQIVHRTSLRGVRNCAFGNAEPNEYVDVCPECGAKESMEPYTLPEDNRLEDDVDPTPAEDDSWQSNENPEPII